MKSLVFILLICYTHAQHATYEWEDWKAVNGKDYVGAEEESKRLSIWEDNKRFVLKHNYEYEMGKHSFKVGLNKFADLTLEEYKFMYLSQLGNEDNSFCKPENDSQALWKISKSLDWRSSGFVTPVKDQKQCGSCWAFSATGSLEGQHFKKTGNLVSLSEQNLVDCSRPEGDMGCEGGIMDYAFKYISLKGIDSEKSYPYLAKDESCNFNPNHVVATLKGCVDIEQGDENALRQAVSTVGPISVAIDASHRSFQLYSEGVYYESECSSTRLDHGVLAVGYGTEDGTAYWLVKNSWGKSWGMKGYLKMSRNRNNNCGIASQASSPVV